MKLSDEELLEEMLRTGSKIRRFKPLKIEGIFERDGQLLYEGGTRYIGSAWRWINGRLVRLFLTLDKITESESRGVEGEVVRYTIFSPTYVPIGGGWKQGFPGETYLPLWESRGLDVPKENRARNASNRRIMDLCEKIAAETQMPSEEDRLRQLYSGISEVQIGLSQEKNHVGIFAHVRYLKSPFNKRDYERSSNGISTLPLEHQELFAEGKELVTVNIGGKDYKFRKVREMVNGEVPSKDMTYKRVNPRNYARK